MNTENQWPLYISIVLVVYAIITLFFVVRGALKTKGIQDYAVGNMGFPSWVVGLSLAASMTSAATFVINPGFISLYGVSGILSMAIVLPLAAFGSLIFFTKGFAKYGKSVSAGTMSQWIGKRFENKSYQFFFAVIALLLITFVVLINVGLTQVISKSLEVEPFYVLVGITVFVFGYMMFGGANSMVYTNTVQALIMVIVAVMMIFSGVNLFEGGVEGFMSQLRAIDPSLTETFNKQSPLFRDFFEVVICQFIVGVAIVCQPYVAAKHGVIGLTKVLALEGATFGVTSNAICPGYVLTPLVEAQIKDQAREHGLSEKEVVEKVLLKKQAVKSFVSLEKIAELCVFLADNNAQSISGSVFTLDGGWSAQ